MSGATVLSRLPRRPTPHLRMLRSQSEQRRSREQPVSAALRAACGVASDQPGGPLIRDGNHLGATSGPDSLNKGRGLTLGRCREVWRAMLKLRTLSDRSWGSW